MTVTFVVITTLQAGAYLREGAKEAIAFPESVFKESIIRVCEIHITNFLNVDHFITKSNYARL
jgi:hypothetical protein